jgi:hypothetical protein
MSRRKYLDEVHLFMSPVLKRAIAAHAKKLGFGISEFLRLIARSELQSPRLASKRKLFGPKRIENRRPRVMPTTQHQEQAIALD